MKQKKYIIDLWHKRQFTSLLIKRTIQRRYRGSYLGVIWTMLNPIMTLLGMALVLPLIVKFRMEQYIIYIFSGILCWGMLTTAVAGGADSILTYQQLLKKIYVPKIIFPFVLISADLFNFIFTAFALHIIALMLGYTVSTNILYFVSATAVLYVFCLSVASLVSLLCVYYRDIKYILGVIMQTLFYVSGIIFPISAIPERYQYLMEFNIFYQFVRLFQQCIYYGSSPEWSYFVIPIFVSIIMFCAAFLIHVDFNKKIVYRI